MAELCGEPTKSGKPCNMPAGHSAQFHRHRVYPNAVEWLIKDAKTKKVLEAGRGRNPLGYAMTYWLSKGSPLIIEVEP